MICSTTWATGYIFAVILSPTTTELRPVTAPVVNASQPVLYCRSLGRYTYINPGEIGLKVGTEVPRRAK